mgnify:CR=1 FL=1
MSLTKTELQRLIHYDPRTGVFTRLVTTGNASKKGDILTGPVEIKGRTYQLNRLAFIYMKGEAPPRVKRIDGNIKNNRWSNLTSN